MSNRKSGSRIRRTSAGVLVTNPSASPVRLTSPLPPVEAKMTPRLRRIANAPSVIVTGRKLAMTDPFLPTCRSASARSPRALARLIRWG